MRSTSRRHPLRELVNNFKITMQKKKLTTNYQFIIKDNRLTQSNAIKQYAASHLSKSCAALSIMRGTYVKRDECL